MAGAARMETDGAVRGMGRSDDRVGAPVVYGAERGRGGGAPGPVGEDPRVQEGGPRAGHGGGTADGEGPRQRRPGGPLLCDPRAERSGRAGFRVQVLL